MTATAEVWSRIFPKKRFEWREPKQFVRAENLEFAGRRPWWVKPGLCFLTCALLMANWSLATVIPNNQPMAFPVALVLAIGGGILMVYGLPSLFDLIPSAIELREDRIVRFRHPSVQSLRYREVDSFEFTRKHGFRVLRIVRKNLKRREVFLGLAPEVFLGVAPDVDTASITAFFESKGLHCAHHPERLPSTGT
jgi:hypothetical protein